MTHTLVSTAGKAIDLGADLADRLNEIAQQPDLLDALAEALAQDRPELPPRLRALLPKPEFLALRTFLKRAAGSLSPGEHLRQLAGPVAETPARGIPWSWKSARKGRIPAVGTSTLSLKRSAEASIRVRPGPGYEFKGALGVAGDLKAPFSFGRVSVSRRRSYRSTLRVKFAHPEDMRVLEALRRDLPVISNLDDPAALLDAAAFKSARLTATGSVRLGAGVEAGRSWMHALDAGGGSMSSKLKAGVSYKLNWVRTGKFNLSTSRLKGGQLRVRLSESQEASRARSLSIGAEVRIIGLGESLAPLMKKLTDVPDRLDGIVKTYSRPSALLRETLEARLHGSDESVRALAKVLVGGGEAAAKRFCGTLIEAIVETADAEMTHWTNLLDGKVDGVVEEAMKRVPVASDRRDELAAIVCRKTENALESVNKYLVRELRAALKRDTEPVRQALARFAEENLEAFDDLDEAAKHCIAPLKRLLADYRVLEQRIKNTVEAAEKERLAIRYGRSVSATDSHAALLRFRVEPSDAATRELYRQMLGGDFADAITAGMDPDNAAIKLEGGVFKRVLEREVTSGLTFNLFGLGIASSRALSTELKVERGAGGQINILKAEGQVSESRAAFSEGQSMHIGSLVNLLTSPDAPDAFTVQLGYTDQNMKPKELRQYLKSLEDAGLIASGATRRTAEMDATLGAVRGRRRRMRIDTTLALARAELRETSNADEETIVRIAIEEQLKAYRRLGWARRALDRLERATGNNATTTIFAWRNDSRRQVERHLAVDHRSASRTARHIVYIVAAITRRAGNLATFIARWQELDRLEVPAPSDGNERLRDAQLREIQELHNAVIEDLRAWAHARGALVGRSREDVSPVAAAFLGSLRRLSSKSGDPLVPVISWTDDGDTQRAAVV